MLHDLTIKIVKFVTNINSRKKGESIDLLFCERDICRAKTCKYNQGFTLNY